VHYRGYFYPGTLFSLLANEISTKNCILKPVVEIPLDMVRIPTFTRNSVFERDITEAKLEKLKKELEDIIDKNEDSIIFYTLREQYYTKREIMGVNKNNPGNVI